MSKKENRRIWDRVFHTPANTSDRKYTKEANNGRFNFTSVCPQYQVEQATDLWGPYGQHWGLDNMRFTKLDHEASPVLMLEAEFFYPSSLPGESGEFPPGARIIRFPVAVDMPLKPRDDTAKKLITSARSKALSWLGFNADVFLGMFEDAAYVKQMERKFGDQDEFSKQVLSRVRTATKQESLDKARTWIEEMVANATITGDLGADLLEEVDAREQQLSGAAA